MLSRLTISKRLTVAFAASGLVLAAIVGLAVRTTSALTAKTNLVADQLDATRAALAVKFGAADLNGWQTAYAFDVIRGIDGAVDDTVGSRKAFLDSVASLRAGFAELDAMGLDEVETTAAARARGVVRPLHGARHEDRRGLPDVARSAAEATQGANDTENAAVELSSLAGDLQSLVGQFRY